MREPLWLDLVVERFFFWGVCRIIRVRMYVRFNFPYTRRYIKQLNKVFHGSQNGIIKMWSSDVVWARYLVGLAWIVVLRTCVPTDIE